MISLSTHVLDTANGVPAGGVAMRLLLGIDVVFDGRTDGDGRCPALRELVLGAGTYRLEFAAGDYFRSTGVVLAAPPFLDVVALEFGLSEGHYHVPLLVSPYAYSTYRGS